MSNSNIVPNLSPEELLNLFRKEARIETDGATRFSLRGVARLVGKDKTTIANLLNNMRGGTRLSKPLQKFAGYEFKAGEGISDLIVSAIVRHYEKKGSDRCSDLLDLFDGTGLRALVHTSQSWTTNRTSSDQIKYQYLLEAPRKWSCQFPDQYYEQLSRLTRLQPKGNHRPRRWAQLTNEFVYSYLPSEIEDGVRSAKLANATNDKLHQFLKPDGLELLQNHLNALMVLMSGVSSVEELRKVSAGRFFGSYQLPLSLVG
jgi:P63C domain